MAAPVSIERVEAALRAPAPRLSISGDDYCVRVESDIDPRYWVRIERGDGEDLVVTDFTAGGRPDAELRQGLVMGIEALQPGPFDRMVFRDLIPAGHQSAQFPRKVVEAFDQVKRLAATVADATGREVGQATMEPRRGKLDAIVDFH
jgi:hypothetical protein